MQQNLLYPETLLVTLPPEIRVHPEVITAGEERDLIAEFEKLDWKTLHEHEVLVRRKVYRPGTDRLPWALEPVIPRAARAMKIKPDEIAEVQILHYPKGAGIGWHQDSDVPGEVVAALTLQSGCMMKFRHEVGSQYELFRTEVPDRSIYVLSGESPWEWQHNIASHQTPRYCVRFRTLGNPAEKPLLL